MGKTPVMQKFYYENKAMLTTEELEMLGVTVGDKMKFEWRIANICRKLSQQGLLSLVKNLTGYLTSGSLRIFKYL